MTRVSTGTVPQAMRPTYEALIALTDAFCTEHLNEEYAEVCRQMAAALCRKRPSPLQSGSLQTWAGGIVHLVGSINFLFDRASKPYLSAADLAAAFGIAKSTTGNKAAQIRQALKIRNLDWHWALPSKRSDYPGAWLIEFDGFIIDARQAPPEIQEEAFRKGFIPYLPNQ